MAQDPVYVQALELLRGLLPQAERALVLDLEGRKLVLRTAYGPGTGEGWRAHTGPAVMDFASRHGKSVLLVDAQQDPRFSRDRAVVANGLRSILCVPFGKEGDKRKGILYVDSRKEPGLFSYEDLAHVDELGTRLAAEELTPSPCRKPEAESEDRRAATRPLLGAAATALLAVLWLLGGLLFQKPAEVTTRKTPGDPTVTSDNPMAIAGSFAGLLKRKEADGAYHFLSPALQETLPVGDFQRRVETYLQDERNNWDIQKRRLFLESREGDVALVTVEPAEMVRGGRAWRWTLIKTDQGWKLDRLESGPIALSRP